MLLMVKIIFNLKHDRDMSSCCYKSDNSKKKKILINGHFIAVFQDSEPVECGTVSA